MGGSQAFGIPLHMPAMDDMVRYDQSLDFTGQKTQRNSSLEDWSRVKYLQEYIGGILDMIRNGHDIRGYFVWSFMDEFELLSGYEFSFGLYYIDLLEDPTLRRQPKLSALWYSNFLNNRTMDPMVAMQIEKNSPLLLNNNSLLHNAI
ncbi:hypothetical protein PIB30_030811 [Stylosanthes scabra]|uniref:Uncharacterized protein n=1 Tax=Stylosanthes scabra TaxID=79078 RepID=A0ABU6RCB8_9FABA|nr:hypothetical protein [Stylosanthes scabra]